MPIQPAIFETHEIRHVYDEASETWWFSVMDIIQLLTQQPDCQAARNYWKVLKNLLASEGSESVTNCNRLKLPAAEGKNYLTDVATAETRAEHIDPALEALKKSLLGELFKKNVRTINEHIQNIFAEGELAEESVIRKFRITAADGKSYGRQLSGNSG